MKTVVFIVSTVVRAGPTQQLLYLCRYLPQFGYRPVVLTLSPDPPNNLAQEFRSADVELSSLGLSRFAGMIQGRRRIRSAVRQGADIIHTSGIRADAIGRSVSLSASIPHVVTIRNYPPDDYGMKFGAVRGLLMARKHLSIIRKAQHPVTCSFSVAQQLGSIHRNIITIQNGVDTHIFKPVTESEVDHLRYKLGIDTERQVVLSVGTLIPRKRPELLLCSFLRSSSRESAQLIFVGDGPLRAALHAAALPYPAIRVVGSVNNVVDYLQCADVFLSTSSSEGLPNSVLEALACGVPVLLSDIASHRELGIQEANAGMLTAGKEEHIAGTLDELLDGDLATCGRNARNLAMQCYSAERMAKHYAELYDRLS